jgi:Leucine-rich repeat (LRR) protein
MLSPLLLPLSTPKPLPGNALEALPEGLFSLPKLHTLNVSRNQVRFVNCQSSTYIH